MLNLDSLEKLQAWAQFLSAVRQWMAKNEYLEVTTDSLVPSSAIDAVLDPLYVTGFGELQTSPEFEMKGILSFAPVPIYQICKSFRDDPLTKIHKREFSMLEFYRPGATIGETSREMRSLMSAVNGAPLEFEELTVSEALKKYAGVDLFAPLEKFRHQAETAGMHLSPDDGREDIYFKLMLEKVEPSIGQDRPMILRDFPASLASLSKVAGDPPVAKRFEIYWQGMELCNGFDELTDLTVLVARVKEEQALRSAQGKTPHPFPHRLYAAMEKGIPESSGVAVGLDRLFNCVWYNKRADDNAMD